MKIYIEDKSRTYACKGYYVRNEWKLGPPMLFDDRILSKLIVTYVLCDTGNCGIANNVVLI